MQHDGKSKPYDHAIFYWKPCGTTTELQTERHTLALPKFVLSPSTAITALGTFQLPLLDKK